MKKNVNLSEACPNNQLNDAIQVCSVDSVFAGMFSDGAAIAAFIGRYFV